MRHGRTTRDGDREHEPEDFRSDPGAAHATHECHSKERERQYPAGPTPRAYGVPRHEQVADGERDRAQNAGRRHEVEDEIVGVATVLLLFADAVRDLELILDRTPAENRTLADHADRGRV